MRSEEGSSSSGGTGTLPSSAAGLWQRVTTQWNGSSSSSPVHGQGTNTTQQSVSFATSNNRNSSFYNAEGERGDGSSSPLQYCPDDEEDDGSSSSASNDNHSHKSLLTTHSNNSSSPTGGSGVFYRTSSSVSSFKEHHYSLGASSERASSFISKSRSSNSLVTMAILDPETTSLIHHHHHDSHSTSSGHHTKQQQQQHGSSSASRASQRKRSKPSRTILYLRHRASATNVSIAVMGLLLCVLAVHRILSLYMNHRRWLNAPITYMQRQCPSPTYDVMRIQPSQPVSLQQVSVAHETTTSETTTTTGAETMAAASTKPAGTTTTTTPSSIQEQLPSICLVTFTDSQSPSWIQRLVRWRNYAGILELTWPNKLRYAQKHGYQLFDHSSYLDISRPPAWSKIPAMQALLTPDSQCDWVLWTDADTVIMNSDIRITDFLPDPSLGLDLVVASDEGGGYNSGVLLFRNTDWSRWFLQTWWNMRDYVRPPGFSLSGDNAAMKALLRDMPDFDQHVAVPPRCTMNSFARFLTLRESKHVMETLEEQEWYMNERFYHKSDFIAHTPGYDNKAECIRLLLQEAE